MTSPPRVALFPSAFAPHVGGVEELTRQLGLELQRRGAAPLVLTNRYPTDLPREEIVDGLSVVRERFSVPLPSPRPLIGYALHGRATSRRLRHALARFEPEVLHVQCVSFQSKYVLDVRRRTGLPLVVTLQGELTMDATDVYGRTPLLRRFWRELLAEADVVTACSQFVLDEAEAALGRQLPRARVVPNGVALRETAGVSRYAHPRRYVLGIGRMVPQKGFDLLLRGFAAVAADLPEVDLLLAGDGPERAALEALSASLGLADRVCFLGAQPHDRALALFRGSSAFVLSSRHEPQGIVVLEAMAMGAPVVAARVGGVPEVVHDGVNGVLFEGGSSDELARVLRSVLAGGEGVADCVRNGARTAEEFDWPVVTDAYLECYQQAGAKR